MTHSVLISEIASLLKKSENEVTDTLKGITENIKKQLTNDHAFSWENFGVFATHKFSEYILAEPQSNKRTLLPPSIIVTFRPVASFKERLIEKLLEVNDKNDAESKYNSDFSKSASVIEGFIEIAIDTLVKGNSFCVDDLGCFDLLKVEENNNNELQTLHAETTNYYLDFTSHSTLSKAVNKPFDHFEPVELNDEVNLAHVKIHNEKKSFKLHEAYIAVTRTDEQPQEVIEEDVSELPSDIEKSVAEEVSTEKLVATFNENDETVVNNELPHTHYTLLESEVALNESVEENRTIQPHLTKSNRQKAGRWALTGVAIVAVITIFFFFSKDRKIMVVENSSPLKQTLDTIRKSDAPQVTDSISQTKIIEPSQTDTVVRQKVRLMEGQTLRSVALEHLGDKEFWVYIYLENKDVIKNPNRVPINILVTLPDNYKYNINASDSLSVEEARKIGDNILKTYS